MAGDEHDAAVDQAISSTPARERPWLLPYNRKLRHLQGITIRNLTLSPSPTGSRGKTIDDAGIPSTLKSPTKALALRENRNLSHSRSSSDLRSTEESARQSNGDVRQPGSPVKALRPPMTKRLRRRSTMDWSGASPLARQKKLEDVTGGRMADTFFTLHVEGQKDPVYISEVAEKAMNPNFRFFDLGSCGPGVTRLDSLTVKVWAKNESTHGWLFLIEFTVQLRALQFIGKTLGTFRHPLPPNCILFHMTDGIYTSFTDLPVGDRIASDLLAAPKPHADGRILTTSTYDALMRLSTLDDCIQDALATRDKLAEEIEEILEKNKEAILTVEQVPEAEERLKTVKSAVSAEKRRVDSARRKRDELKASIQHREEKMQEGRELQARVENEILVQKEQHTQTKDQIQKTEEDIAGQRRRICEDLLKIFPIEPIPGKALGFTIRGLFLPNAEFDDVKEDVTSAALGYVAQVVSLLSPYLSVVLPYPVTPNGSASTIEDPLAMNTSRANNLRTYPLFMKGVVRYRFEYGVFLLNKDIEILSNSLGLRPIDVRHTLPNLKYLLFVATAGKGELPGRKAGGIRGLLRQDGMLSRKGSMDSTATASSAGAPEPRETLEAIANGGRRVDGPKANGKAVSSLQTLHKQKRTGTQSSRLREVQ
ncbi:UV radiation resistance protein and autophagy-related subunit 14-domain-containing protein [Clohesyomyces aquaticus]|uniref:Autophagy-related protein 14 n=1 Tax=Clohesyomyces aquaticus TaxID=1231657 RepID=A0A1Y1Y3Z5_9PLEO|nr:UV radiation resistance protein and autophagy-related subunit 14-domain-containing protein [Clohesyomyces aquaticus]